MLQDIENKLHVIRVEINNSDFDRAGGDGLVTVPGPNQRKTSISEKIDCLAELLGLTLYGAKWRCPPRTQSRPQIGPDGLHVPDPQTGHRGQSVTPPRSIKDELHAIEICLEEIKEEIGRPPPRSRPRTRSLPSISSTFSSTRRTSSRQVPRRRA